ncbi:DUF2207 domain-containing protein [Flindersiella endophytica]
MRGVLRLLAGAGVLLLGLLWCAGGAQAADNERIRQYDVEFGIRHDGQFTVDETIEYDFGAQYKHGITRDIPNREEARDGQDRIWGIEDIKVSSPSGAPADLEVDDDDDEIHLRIGDEDKTINGRQTYKISYVVTAGLNAFDDHDELYWDAIGTAWSVPIDQANVTVHAPGGINRVACFTDDWKNDDRCASAKVVGPQTATFAQKDVSTWDGLTIVVGLAKGVVNVPAAHLVDSNNRTGGPIGELAATTGPLQYGLGGGIAILAMVFAGVSYWRNGRDQRTYDVPLGMKAAVAPEFSPPENVQPGLAGTLIDEKASGVEVSATVVHLAVRRYLRMEEIPAPNFWSNRDWKLTKLPAPSNDRVTAYERKLLDRIFAGKLEEVKLSDLKYSFAGTYRQLIDDFYREMVSKGWYRKDPNRARAGWRVGGMTLLIAGGILAGASVGNGQLGLALLFGGFAVAGLILRLSARAMPGRTAKGSEMHQRVQGFKRYLETAEADQLQFEATEDIFSRYLPYAMVFGVVDKWAKVFSDLAESRGVSGGTTMYWYVGSSVTDFGHLGTSMSNFSSAAGSTMSATQSSGGSSGGSSGFSGGSSGGGGGGGGGGSW